MKILKCLLKKLCKILANQEILERFRKKNLLSCLEEQLNRIYKKIELDIFRIYLALFFLFCSWIRFNLIC